MREGDLRVDCFKLIDQLGVSGKMVFFTRDREYSPWQTNYRA
jgi:hypothetical protein